MTTMNKPTLIGMTLAAGLLVAPMLAFGQAANNSTGTTAGPTMNAPGTTGARPDGTPGNPPSTATGRALDRATGTPSNPDGVGNNPPGTAVGRALDRAVPNSPDGTAGNPPGTAAGRALDRAVPNSPDGTPGNPPGTAVGRALDRATGNATPSGPANDVIPNSQGGRNAERSGATGAGTPGAGTMGAATMGAAGAAGATTAMGEQQRVSQIIGSRVYNDRNEAIGEVDDVILTGTSPTAVISVGGFLGIGARLVSVPLSDIRWNAERERMMLPGATKEQLQSRPAFDYGTLRRG